MCENITERVLFKRCHDKLRERAVELKWQGLDADTQFVALLEEEVELARITNDAAICMLCYEDLGDIAYCPGGTKYKKIEKEMLRRAAELGDMEASQRLADYVFIDGDFNEAARCAVEHLKRGGEIGDFEDAELEPRHDHTIEDNETLPWLQAVMEVRPSDKCRYVLARCYWDLEELIDYNSDKIALCKDGENHDKALALYERAADDGYFWSQLYFGLYLLQTGSTGSGVVYLEKALAHIPETPEPNENYAENEETREWLRARIEQALFKYTGKISKRVRELEERARHDDLAAYIDLAMAYMEGEECPRDQEKSFAYASRLLFEDKEFTDLLIRMDDDLTEEDRAWLDAKLHEEARRLEAMT